MLQTLEVDFWDNGSRHLPLIHNVHPYFGKFSSAIPNNAITFFSKEGDTVLDPFCGCGTTLVEARVLGRHAFGVDINPLSCLISKVKSTPISVDELANVNKMLYNVHEDINLFYSQDTLSKRKIQTYEMLIPKFKNREHWFESNVLNELGIIKAHIYALDNKDLRDFCLVAFSSIITKVSNQSQESRYSKVKKNITPSLAFHLFSENIEKMRQAIKDFDFIAKDVNTLVFNEDTKELRSIQNDTIDLIVTSPPLF